MTEYYIYLHLRADNRQPFYVGKGKGGRAYVKTGRSKYWNRVVSKYGYAVEILFENLSEEEAFGLEKDIIAELRYFNYPLVNLTNGGEGSSGYHPSEETKRKLSIKLSGIKRTKEEIEKSRISRTGLKKSAKVIENMRKSRLGKRHTKETIEKMSKVKKENPSFIDENNYIFFNKTGDIFIGTRVSLSRNFNIKPADLRNLFLKNNPAPSAKGWSIMTVNLLFILCVINN